MIKQKKIEPLVSEELISKVKELGTLSKQEKAKACGYYSVTKNGVERVNMKQFLNALINAEGIDLDGNSKANEHEEPIVSYPVTTQPSQIRDLNNVITVIRTNKPTTKPLLLSQPVQQLEIESVQEPEIEQLEQPPESYINSLIEPIRDESVYGSGWSVTELMNEFSGR